MKKIKYVVASLVAMISMAAVTLPSVAMAETPKQAACSAIGSSSCADTSGGANINNIISAVVNILSIVVGVTAVIMIIVGGFKYITSGGASNKAASARGTIIYAIVGLVVALFAQGIVYFVLDRLK